MYKLSKTLLTAAIITTIGGPVVALAGEGAENIKLKLGGALHTQVGGVSQKARFKHADPSNPASDKLRDWPIIVNDTKIVLNADGKAEKLNYGMEMQLYADASAAKTGNTNNAKNTSMYIESAYGRLEGGSRVPANETLKVGGHVLAKATGGIDGDMVFWVNQKTSDGEDFASNFLTAPYLPIGHDWTARANKITYYTPELFPGLKAGISYIPESLLVGTISRLNSDTIYYGDGSYRDVLDAAVQYKAKLGETELTASYSGQYGDAKFDNGVERTDLRAWEIGLMAEHKGFAIAGSYGDWGKSGTAKPRLADKKYGAKFWTAGMSYDYGKAGASLTYFQSVRAGGLDGSYHEDAHNKMKVLALGLEYKLADGLLSYIDASGFKMERVGASYNNSGIVTIAGLKVKW